MSSAIFGLPVHLVSRGIFNCYVIEGTGDATVIVDPGVPVVANAALGLLGKLGRSESSIKAVTCSHGHPDHMAGMPTLNEAGVDAFYLPHKCESYLAGEQPRAFGHDHTLRFLPVFGEQRFSIKALLELARSANEIGFRGPEPFLFPLTPAGFLGGGSEAWSNEGTDNEAEPEDQTSSALPGAEGWTVIDTPGHTDDSICFYHQESETLISGDAVVTHDGQPWFNPEWVDTTLSAETEEMLRALPVTHLLPGHGRAVSGDVWKKARSFRTAPTDNSFLSRCARRFGDWDY